MSYTAIICHSYNPEVDDTRTDTSSRYCSLGEGVWIDGFFEDIKQAVDRMNEIVQTQITQCLRFHEDVKNEKDIVHDRGDYYWTIATPNNYRLAVQIQLLEKDSPLYKMINGIRKTNSSTPADGSDTDKPKMVRNCDKHHSLWDAVVAFGTDNQGWSDWPDEDVEPGDVNELINRLTADQVHELVDWLYTEAGKGHRTGETVEDIVQSMCGYAAAMDERFKEAVEGDKRLNCNTIAFRMREFANRIKRARERENTKPAENVNSKKVVYSNEKMREALEIISQTELPPNSHTTEVGEVFTFADGNKWLGKIRTFVALAKCALSAQSEPIGNNAKMREALGKILWCLEWMFNNTDDKSVQSHLAEPISLAKSALAEPPRNCDLPTVIAKPHGAWLKDCDNWDDFGNPKMEIHEWLLAKAKGETDGSK